MKPLPSIAALLMLLSTAASATLAASRIDLLADRSLAAWEFVATPAADLHAVCTFRADGTLALAGKPIGYLATRTPHDNYRLHVEWRWTGKPGNGGILVHIATGPIDRNTWPRCLQIQTKHGRAGDLLPMAGATFAEPLSTSAGAKTPILNRRAPDSEKPLGEWNAADIVCRNATVDVSINGVRHNHITHCLPAAGRIGLQFEGSPYEVRDLHIEPLP
jgi:hypothetical protein